VSALELIEDLILRHPVQKVVTDVKTISRGYVFLVEHEHEYYVLVNALDMNIALVRMYNDDTTKQLSDYLHGVPLVESWMDAARLSSGVFRCALQVQ
jgi:hypothetical protein